MTTATANKVLRAGVTTASEIFGEDLSAVFAVGSLAHDGFAPFVSDVDVALVLAGVSTGIEEVGRLVRERHPGGLAERLSIFWTALYARERPDLTEASPVRT
ncbi:MAG TPA: hypothetical protein VJ870_00570 [Amycolatopsis sp.]|nr:hypothetical protein [Amycolatopsis sp.]